MTAFEDRLAISALAFADEREAVHQLLGELGGVKALGGAIAKRATLLTTQLRAKGSGGWLEAFLHEYGLGTQEGVAVMCLTEALLRIPDARTADRLIASTFDEGNWEKHLGRSDFFFVNASSWGLLLTSKLVNVGREAPGSFLRKLTGRIGEPAAREALKAAMRFIGTQFVLGETIHDAADNAERYQKQGYRFSYDILGEGARSDAQAQYYVESYREVIALLAAEAKGVPLFDAPGISVKLSALFPRYQLTQADRVREVLMPRLKEILQLARQAGIAVAIDAEEAHRFDLQLALFSELAEDKALAGWNGLGFVVQAYQKRARTTIDYLARLARQDGRVIPVRLVKGAYWDSEIKLAQVQSLPGYPVFTRKEHTDVSYLACADALLKNIDCFYPQFATHNARTAASIQVMAAQAGVENQRFEFQRLHGMGEMLHDLLIEDYRCRIYAPVGRHKDLLAYLIRRLLENGANTSFVNLLMDADLPMEQLIADPIATTMAHDGTPHPNIPLPKQIYRDRLNSAGLDFGNLAMLRHCEAIGRSNPVKRHGREKDTVCAADAARWIASPSARNDVTSLLTNAQITFPIWSSTSVEHRASLLEALANSIEAHRDEFLYLLATEAKRTLADGVSEVREAADFCRYYALQARRVMNEPEVLRGPTGESNHLGLHPRGVFACISPWNFPLAIFTGQVAAALVTGNTVIAKPAEQTPLIAARAVELMHAAGFPQEAVQLLTGDGKVGAALVASDIDGVVFTGSHDTARLIHRSLADRLGPIVPLIAETGGVNCMVVDSSALLEQAVDDIALSAFGSAGQRCSALRVLYAQEDIAKDLLELLAGAMQELRLGDPLDISTDIGPVIDAEAQAVLLKHIERMKKEARLIAATPLPKKTQGHFVAPHAFEIEAITQLPGEIFGPILHVVRFGSGADERERVAREINATGFGLTFGIHSRIGGNIDFFAAAVRAGNIYVNRSMIGATVGVQPFGGELLSGTGPKAGGPHYLTRFLTERTVTVNTAAIGGNVALLTTEEGA